MSNCVAEAMRHVNTSKYDFNNIEIAIQDFKFYNKNIYHNGRVCYCQKCNIIHVGEDCPLCEGNPIDCLVDTMSELESEIESITKEFDNLKKATSETELGQTINELEAEIEVLEKENNRLSNSVGKKISQIDELAKEVAKLKNHRRTLVKRIKDMANKPWLRHILADR